MRTSAVENVHLSDAPLVTIVSYKIQAKSELRCYDSESYRICRSEWNRKELQKCYGFATIRSCNAIIDDGLLISHGKVIAGTSAKKEPTKIASVKHALFMNPSQVNEIKKVLKRNKIKCLMILGTSDGMVNKIAKNIGVPCG